MDERIDPKEQKLLGDILALVLDDHQGQAESALVMLRRRAQHDRITGGALKGLFDQLTAGEASAREAVEQLSRNVRQLQLQQAGLQTELALERRTAAGLAASRRQTLIRLAVLAPALALACLVLGFVAGFALGGSGGEARGPRVSVNPSPASVPVIGAEPRAVVTPGPQPSDAPVLSVEVRSAIGQHLRACRLDPSDSAGSRPIVRVRLDLTEGGVIRAVRISPVEPPDGTESSAPSPDFQAYAQRISQALLAPDCAALPLPPYLLGRVRTVVFRFAP